MSEICPVHSETTRLIEKQTERTDSLFIEVRGLVEDVAVVETKATGIRTDHNVLSEKVEEIDERVRDLENFKAATSTSLQEIKANLKDAAEASKEFSTNLVDMNNEISMMAVKVAGIISVLTAAASYLVNKLS